MPESAPSTYFTELIGRPQIWGQLHQAHRAQLPPIVPIFVVGSPRSGTTVTGRIIGAHPDVRCVEESLFLTHLYDMLFELHLGLGQRKLAPLQHIPTTKVVNEFGNLADELLGAPLGEGRIVDHTPWYGAIAPFLDAMYPNCVFVHVLRNGIDVVTSLGHSYNKGFAWAGETLEQRARLWSTMVDTCDAIAEHIESKRFVRLRYEDLIAQPQATIFSLLEALRLSWDPVVMQPLTRPHSSPSRQNWMVGSERDSSEAAEARAWTSAETNGFANAAAMTMRRHGYRCPP